MKCADRALDPGEFFGGRGATVVVSQSEQCHFQIGSRSVRGRVDRAYAAESGAFGRQSVEKNRAKKPVEIGKCESRKSGEAKSSARAATWREETQQQRPRRVGARRFPRLPAQRWCRRNRL